MHVALLAYLNCPLCHSSLDLTIENQVDAHIESGQLRCRGCGQLYPIVNGIPNMLSTQFAGIAAKRGEARGWQKLAQHEAWYEDADRIDLVLPYVVRDLGWDPVGAADWEATRLSFERLLEAYVQPGMRVLEIGAAKSWAGRYFLARGCEYTASDILDDAHIGLGRARFFGARFGYYEAVVADAEHLPFADAYFDLTFAIAALHHSLDLDRMVRELARVTRRGGLVAGLNEGMRSFLARADADSQSREKGFGINEHAYTLWDYRRAFRGGGLRVVEMRRGIGYDQLLAPRLKLFINPLRRLPRVGEALAAWLLLGVIHAYDGVSLYARKV
jgi:uncharacterized protein YbaR (Trm112 family)/SAM-dependent methyltransferase